MNNRVAQRFPERQFHGMFFARDAMRPFDEPHQPFRQRRDRVDLASYPSIDFQQRTCASAGKLRMKICWPASDLCWNHGNRLTPGRNARRVPNVGENQKQAKLLIF